MYQVPHKSSISEKRPRVPAWDHSDSDCTLSHDIKSIKTHCGTFFAWLRQTSTRLTARVVVGEGASEDFVVKIGLRQGSVLSPLLFIAVLDLTSRKTVVKDAMKKLIYADDLALANGNRSYIIHWRSGTDCLPDTG